MTKIHVLACPRQSVRAIALLLCCGMVLQACSPVPAQPSHAGTADSAPRGNASSTQQPTAATVAAASAPAQATATASAPAPLPLLQFDDGASQITVIVRRGGLLARLGHDHLIRVKNLRGSIDQQHNRASLQFRLDEMLVDPPELRLAAGLSPQPSADAVAGTRQNMLNRVLDAARYPLVVLEAERSADGQSLQLSLTLHGVTRRMQLPAKIQSDGRSLRAEGSFTILQSDYGITPFAVMGGALAVQDQLELHYRLLAH
ncbi:YceI family protein [Duganella fentianensis]|uniref:YceI family protein n=1 Tax=Duganella fentianensis TaxID=2692177 RepID=UPI0032B2A503